MNYYEVLGVDKKATPKEIKIAYRKKALEFHPDRNKDEGAGDKFKAIAEAYSVLGDEQKRREYDNPNPVRDFFGFNGFNGWTHIHVGHATTWEDFFFAEKRPIKGANITQDVYISLKDSIQEIENDIKIEHLVPCIKCNHTGKIKNLYCPECMGTGEIKQVKTLKFVIPAGIENNTILRLAEQGNCGKNGGPTGDIFLRIKIKKDNYYFRQGLDALCTRRISFIDAILGTELKITSLYDTIEKIKISPGTQAEDVYTIDNLGFPDMRNPKIKGQMKVKILISLPKKLTDEQKTLLQSYKELEK